MTDLLQISLTRDKTLKLFVKADKKWEEFLSKRKIRETSNAFEGGNSLKYYDFQFRNAEVDNIERSIFRGGVINWAILKLVGISNGVEIDTNELVTAEVVKEQIRKIIEGFKVTFTNLVIPIRLKALLSYEEL